MKTISTSFSAGRSLLAALTFCFALSACKKDDESGPVVNNDLFSSVKLVTTSGSYTFPTSAVPDASDAFLYFVASDTSGGAGVFKVPAAGGAASQVYVGAPFITPIDLVLSTDNQTIYVADSAAGGILALNIAGGVPTIVSGTGGTKPVALELIQRSGADKIYFCGTNVADGQKAVFEISSAGAANADVRYKGPLLIMPAGIVAARDGSLFIADRAGTVSKLSASGVVTQIAGAIIMGAPAGIALTPDDKIVAVSSKSPADGTAQVQLIDLQTGGLSIFNKVIGANKNPGGLHAARNAGGPTGKYAWADVQRPGRVYRLEP